MMKSIGVIAFVILFVLCLVGSIWFRYMAPCKDMGFLPVKDVPARCITFVRQ